MGTELSSQLNEDEQVRLRRRLGLASLAIDWY